MSYEFEFSVTPEATELRLKGPNGSTPTDSWAIEAPPALLAGVDLVQRLVASGAAIAVEDVLYIEHRAVAGLSATEAKSLGLSPVADVIVQLETTGVITRPDFRVKLQWRRLTGQPVMSASR